ncbi:MAG: transporter substrate-binding domain-containing protein [Colwellia sp.]|nr:transporter substrate-binding domain-containing protein [Colwellia sp.]
MKSSLIRKMKYLPLLLTPFLTISNAANYVVGVEKLDYLPHYAAKGGEYTGFARDLLDAFAKANGHTFTYVPRPITRLFDEFLNKDTLDFKYPDNAYWATDDKKGKNIQYTVAVVRNHEGFMVLPEKKGMTLDNFKNVGTIKGFTAWKIIEQINAGKIKIKESKTFESLLKKVLVKRIDAAYLNVDVAKYQLNSIMGKAGELVFDENLPNAKGDFYLSTRKHAGVITEFNVFLTQEKATVDAIKAKYKLQ